MQTKNLANEKFEILQELFPNAITESINDDGELVRAVDKDALELEISTNVVGGGIERYQFTWPEKRKAILNANAPISKTLRPCREESLNFDETENLYIEGDNLEVLKLLQETYLGKVKMIYIDPPYNTGSDFVYNDDFKQSTDEYLEDSGQFDEDGNRLEKNLESNGRFHTDWLNMIYPRLKLARNLLSDDGVIFISIDDNEQANLKKVCDEIFGESNFIAILIRKIMEGGKSDSKGLAVEHEYCLVYCKNDIRGISKKQAEILKHYNKKDNHFNERGYYYLKPLENRGLGYVPSLDYPIIGPDGVEIYPGDYNGDNGYRWVWSKSKFEKAQDLDMIVFTKSKKDDSKFKVYYKIYEKVNTDGNYSEKKLPFGTLYLDGYTNRQGINDLRKLYNNRIFSYPKSVNFLKETISMGANINNSIILDFFSGSSTTADAVMQLNAEDGGNRKFIMVQLSEETDEKSEAYKAGYKNICEIGKERIHRAGKKILEDNKDKEGIENLDIGFRVLKADTSNMKDVYYKPGELNQNFLDTLTDNIKEDRTGEDLLFQVMLDLGIPLSSKIETEDIDGKEIFIVDDGYLIASFDRDIDDSIVTKIANREPAFAVFRDSSMKSDSALNNFDQIFERLSPETTRRVI